MKSLYQTGSRVITLAILCRSVRLGSYSSTLLSFHSKSPGCLSCLVHFLFSFFSFFRYMYDIFLVVQVQSSDNFLTLCHSALHRKVSLNVDMLPFGGSGINEQYSPMMNS